MKTEKISELTTNRLSIYLRCLNELSVFKVKTVSSQAMADQFNLNSAQIRKDLAYFGEFGVRGVGYYVEDLRQHLMKILGLTEKRRVAIVGLGNLGRRWPITRALAITASRSWRYSTLIRRRQGRKHAPDWRFRTRGTSARLSGAN